MKKIFIKILGLFLSIFIFILLLSFYGKNIYTGFIVGILGDLNTNIEDKQFSKDNNKDDTFVVISKNYTINDIFNSPKYKELLKNKKVKELIEKNVDITLNGITDSKYLENIDIGEDIISFIEENRELLEKEFDIKISDKDISNLKENEEFKSVTDNYISSVKSASNELSSGQKKLIKGFNFICSTLFKIILFILIIIDLILIAILESPFYRMIKSLGINVIFSGILTIILGLVLNIGVNNMIARRHLNLHFNFLSISIVGGVAVGVGIVILIAYFFIKKVVDKNSMEELYEQVSHGKEELFQGEDMFSSDDE